METPLVTVIVPVHNAMPYLHKCVESVLEQSIGKERLELIAIDDGSNDGSGEALDKYAAGHENVRIAHQAASGTPSVPRNRALDMARGKYVFFLDADDYLGAEALERMVTMAEENDSDIVLGKHVSVGGREVPKSMYTHDQPRADLYSSRVYWTLGCLKLFRRDLIERHGLRFPTDRRLIEDLLFTVRAYCHAGNISVVGDYDCYFVVLRDDGGNLTTGGMETPEHFKTPEVTHLELLVDLVGELLPDGPNRDYLMKRHWEIEGYHTLGHLCSEPDPGRQRERLEELQRILMRWYTPGAARQISPELQLAYHLVFEGTIEQIAQVRRGKATVLVGRGGRVWATLPGHEDTAGEGEGPWVDVTGSIEPRHWLDGAAARGPYLELRGTGRLARIPSEQIEVRLEAVQTRTGAVRRFPLEHDRGIFKTRLDLRRDLGAPRRAAGEWTFYVVPSYQGFEQRALLGTSIGGPLLRKPLPQPQWRPLRHQVAADQHLDTTAGLRLDLKAPSLWALALRPLHRIRAGLRR